MRPDLSFTLGSMAWQIVTTCFIGIVLVRSAQPPVVTDPAAITNIAENDPGGRVFYTVRATHPDPGILTYAIMAYPSTAAFSIGSTNGAVTLTSSPGLDFETTQVYRIVITVTDATGMSGTGLLMVMVTDVNEAPAFSNLPNTAGSASVEEDATGTKPIYTVTATDPEGDAITFSLASPTAAPFFVRPNGEVHVKATPSLDYESTPEYALVITVSDGTLTLTELLTVSVINVNDAPVVRNLPLHLTVPRTAQGAIFYVDAFDEDGDALTYQLSTEPRTNPGMPFSITINGAVNVTNPPGLNPSRDNVYVLTVTATDTTGLTGTGRMYLTVVERVDEPEIVNLPMTVMLNENIAGRGRAIYTVKALDLSGKKLTFSMTANPIDGKFRIDTNTGQISYIVDPHFDFETHRSYLLTVTASNTALSSTSKRLHVHLINVNEPPQILNLPATRAVKESVINEAAIFQLNGLDPDRHTILVYSMNVIPASGSSKFSLDSLGGVIRVVKNPSFDYESQNQYILKVSVTDGHLVEGPYDLNVDITDVNERPIFPAPALSVQMEEEKPVEWYLPMNCVAKDPDAGEVKLIHAIEAGPHSRYFALDTTSNCRVKLTSTFDSEDPTSPDYVTIEISARDRYSLHASMGVNVYSVNVNEHRPLFTMPEYTMRELENLPAGTRVIQVEARDKDTGRNGQVSYRIIGSQAVDLFQVNKTGWISRKAPLDREAPMPRVTFLVEARDNGSLTRYTSTASIHVIVLDENDNMPIFELDSYHFQLPDNSHPGTIVGQVNATDKDGSFGTLHFEILGGSKEFVVNPSSGQISTGVTIQGDNRYTMYMVAEDNGTPSLKSAAAKIQVDVLRCVEALALIEVAKPSEYFDEARLAQFEIALRGLLAGRVPKVMRVRELGGGDSGVEVFYLMNDYMDGPGLLPVDQSYVRLADILHKATLDTHGTPSPFFGTNVFDVFPVRRVLCACCVDTGNWWLDRTEGRVTTRLLSGFGIFLVASGAVFFGRLMKRRYQMYV